MFTGIISEVGTVRAIEPGTDTRFVIETDYDVDDIAIGASIACSGPCMTVVDKGRDTGAAWFAVEASPETLARTTLGSWAVGRRINLERALKVGDELGGHLVSGHVDGVARLKRREALGDAAGSARFTIEAPEGLSRFVAEKGSVALDGVSLTVNDVENGDFTVNVIPHTLEATTLGQTEAGADLNFEADLVARYLNRLVMT
ncbi:MAG TPA: riboflavin synthase [Alphaproteobacteria bacterium]|nr:riboflavin synthase [Alphaproteobacteria bacterium]